MKVTGGMVKLRNQQTLNVGRGLADLEETDGCPLRIARSGNSSIHLARLAVGRSLGDMIRKDKSMYKPV